VFMRPHVPSWAFQVGLAVTLLLVIAAAVHTLTTGLPVRVRQIVGAVVVATVGIAGPVLRYVTAGDATQARQLWVWLTPLAAAAVAAAACALSSGRVARLWWAATGAIAVVAIGAVPLHMATARLALLPQDIAFALDGRLGLVGKWFDDPFAGAMFGVSVALLALLPRALSVPDSPLATEPPLAEPLSPPKVPAPVAVPGVPEVLSWP